MLGTDLDGNHPLLRPYRHHRHDTRCGARKSPPPSLALLQSPHQPGESSHGPHKEHHNKEGLGHAPAIHG